MANSPAHGRLIADWLRACIPSELVPHIAERTGKAERTIRAWRAGECAPTAEELLFVLIPEFGPGALNELLAPLGMCGVRWTHKAGVAAHVLLTKGSHTVAVLAEALEDHRVDHLEAPKVDAAVADLVEAATHFRARKVA